MKYEISYHAKPKGFRVRVWEPHTRSSKSGHPYVAMLNFHGIATKEEAIAVAQNLIKEWYGELENSANQAA